MFLQDFGVILSQCTGRKEGRKEEFRSLEVRGKLIALKKAVMVHCLHYILCLTTIVEVNQGQINGQEMIN